MVGQKVQVLNGPLEAVSHAGPRLTRRIAFSLCYYSVSAIYGSVTPTLYPEGKRTMKFRLVVAFCVAVGCTAVTHAADIALRPDRIAISISGKIEPGDYRRLATLLIASKPRFAFLSAVHLDSPGGDVREAMKIARLLERSFTVTFIDKGSVCASACVMIWAAGVERSISGKLGVHRISAASNNVDIDKAEKVVRPAVLDVESFLREQGIPRRIIDKMHETPASEVVMIDLMWLIKEDLIDTISYRPSFIDIAAKKCGADPVAAAGIAGVPVDKAEMMKWMICVDDVRLANQTLHLDEIVSLIGNGSGYGRRSAGSISK